MLNLASMRNSFIASVLSLAIFSPSHADDTEIFFGQSADAFETNPNILFVLDVSGSMGATDGVGITRLNRMKNAMRLLLEQSSNYNVGLMTFNGRFSGAAVRYPIADLDSDSGDFCENGICPDETVFVRPQDANDDAFQNNDNLEVSVNENFLVLGNVDIETIERETGTTTADNTFEDTEDANLVSKSFIASFSGQENTEIGSDLYQWNTQQSEHSWFYQNDVSPESLFGYQFENIDIPRNALITSANITFTLAAGANQSGDVSAFISGEQTSIPEPFPAVASGELDDYHTFEERLDNNNRTNKVVSWDAIPGTTSNPSETGDTITTPDMGSIIDELVKLPSWESGNTMSFIVSPLDNYIDIPENDRTVSAAGAEEHLRPVLTITFEEVEDQSVETLIAQSTEHVDEFLHENTLSVWRNTNNKVSNLFYVGPGNQPRNVALRFPNINVPKGSTIESVFLKLAVRDNEAESPADDWAVVQGTEPGEGNGAIDGVDPAPSTTPITLNIRAELSADPTDDVDTVITERDLTADFISWETSEFENTASTTPGATHSITSPSISAIVQQAIDLSDWENGDTLSLILAPDGSYSNDPSDVLRILTGNSNSKPELEITFSTPEVTVENTAVPFTSAIRFRNVHVPPGATIQSARVIVHAAAPNGEEANLSIRGELTPNSQPFTNVNNDIGQRTPTGASVTWNPEPWEATGNEYSTLPVTNIIQEITEQSAWCGGNSLTLMISGSDGHRFAESIESDAINAPALEIVYAPSSVTTEGFCSNSSIILSAAQNTDDGAEDTTTGAISLSDTYLSTAGSETSAGEHVLGLRFQGLQLPQGAEITNATIEFVAATDNPSPFSMNIAIQDTVNAQPYSSTNNHSKINNRTYSGNINWSGQGVAAGENVFSADLTSLLKTTVDKPNWSPGNAVAFKIEAQSGLLDVVSNDGEEAFAPRLIVYYQTLRLTPGTAHRAQVQQRVDDLQAVGGTPIVSSLYEAASYLSGRPVDYGTFRGRSSGIARLFRVSHPGSYDGGTVNRRNACKDSNLNHGSCRFETIKNTPTPPVYVSPINSQCQSNHIVLLSDGAATSNTAIGKIENLIGTSCSTSVGTQNRCGAELASWLNTTDHSSEFPEDQTINTHTIGFNISNPQFLMDIAEAGGGAFEPASSAADLLGAFKKILNNVSNRNASFVSPGASVSQFNRLRNSNDVYYAMFKPSGTARWEGNLKRYEIDVTANDEFGIFDSNGNPAVDTNDGTFEANSRSFWSTVTDGDNVDFGGAAEQLSLDFIDFSKRNVYTYNTSEAIVRDTDLTAAVNQFDPNNATLNIAKLNLPPLVENDPLALFDVIAWGKGADVDDENGDGNTTQVRADMGDPMHATPLVTNYADGESVIYMATNEGFLHALDTDSGEEHFAFIPEELYKNVYRFYQNQATKNRPYGLDGGKLLWHDDTDKDGLIDPNETAILYIAMRRGGSSYFALDVSDYKKPKYLWSIKGGEISENDSDSTTAQGDWGELATTWSLPVKTKILDGSDEKDVIIFAGGYDQNQDPTGDLIVNGEVQISQDVRTIDSTGRAIFIADARTGEQIWSTDFTDPFDEMNYSIPSRVRVLDVNFDGIVDQLYVGDMGGQLWRMDFNNSLVSTESIGGRINAGIIASIAGDTPDSNRKFYYPPDVAVINLAGRQVLTISIGSGWRAHPLDNVVKDAFYSFRSSFVFGAPINSFGVIDYSTITEENTGLVDVTGDIAANVDADSLGWFLRFEEAGEKPLGSSLTFNNQLVFTTYQPSNAGFSCEAAIGNGFIYALNIYNGAPILDLDQRGADGDLTAFDRSRVLANPGIPPEVTVLFPETNPGSGLDNEPLFQVGKETIPELDGGDISQTTFWQEASENHDE